MCVASVHVCMECYDNPNYEKCVNSADIVVPDGRPLFWLQKLLGYREAKQVRGVDLTWALIQYSAEKKLRLGFYGASEGALKKISARLRDLYPKLEISYLYSPPYRYLGQLELERIYKNIDKAKVDILFEGLGCPKQERWMYEAKDHLSCVMLGVGAAFDFIAGNKKEAPKWLSVIGFEWLWRLICEPKRLWWRYFKHNPRFVLLALRQLLQNFWKKHG